MMKDSHPSVWGPRPRLGLGEQARTLAGQTAQRLRQDIIHNRLAPSERLTFDKLSKLYGVGSSPIREALFQVVAEGLVVAEDHKGFIVAPINFGEMIDVSRLRAHLETFAVAESIRQGDEDWETRILTAQHRLRRVSEQLRGSDAPDEEAKNEWEGRHRALHHSLCSACGSPWTLHFFDVLYDQLERYRRYFWKYTERAVGADREHDEIVEAALARDEALAVSLLKAHFKRQAELTIATQKAVQAAA
ncbi:MAG: FCD domain-containing protein [Pigmentiphaga sp.]